MGEPRNAMDIRPGYRGRAFTSDLSGQEFWLVIDTLTVVPTDSQPPQNATIAIHISLMTAGESLEHVQECRTRCRAHPSAPSSSRRPWRARENPVS